MHSMWQNLHTVRQNFQTQDNCESKLAANNKQLFNLQNSQLHPHSYIYSWQITTFSSQLKKWYFSQISECLCLLTFKYIILSCTTFGNTSDNYSVSQGYKTWHIFLHIPLTWCGMSAGIHNIIHLKHNQPSKSLYIFKNNCIYFMWTGIM